MYLPSLLVRLSTFGPVNEIAIALLLTESKFRPLSVRIVELFVCAWIIACKKEEPKLTIGMCQVEFKYWRKRFGKNNANIFLQSFRYESNYQICCDFLRERASLPKATLLTYNGKPSFLYVGTYEKIIKRVRKANQALSKRRSTEILLEK